MVKKTTTIDQLFNAYSQLKGVDASLLRFFSMGYPLRGDQTIGGINMHDGGLIYVAQATVVTPGHGPALPPRPFRGSFAARPL